MNTAQSLFRLLQLVSPALPVGAYSYSEGLETLVQQGSITEAHHLQQWLLQELNYGAIRLETAVLLRLYQSIQAQDLDGFNYWNAWLSSFRESEELREQSWQMGRSLSRLLVNLEPELRSMIDACHDSCNFAAAFAIAAVCWQLDPRSTILGYLYSWLTNLVNAGIRLIPLGQTQGQQLLLSLYCQLEATADQVIELSDDRLCSCNWGLALASMNHEVLYSRLFRS